MNRCDCCQQEVRLGPMFLDAIWEKLAEKGETLCWDCIEARAQERGIDLRLADLRPCGHNLMHHPRS
jgi:hypothetical protein